MGDKLNPARQRKAVMDLAQDGNVRTVAKRLEMKHAHIVPIGEHVDLERFLISVPHGKGGARCNVSRAGASHSD